VPYDNRAINRRGYHHVAGGKPFHQLAKRWPVDQGAGDLLAEYLYRTAPP
jgi:hypothetical protein